MVFVKECHLKLVELSFLIAEQKGVNRCMYSWNCVFDTENGSVLKNESQGDGGLLVLIPKKICPKSTARNMLRRKVKELFRVDSGDKNNFDFLIKFKKNDIEFVDELKSYLNVKS
jgi:ribonuclease P protein component